MPIKGAPDAPFLYYYIFAGMYLNVPCLYLSYNCCFENMFTNYKQWKNKH